MTSFLIHYLKISSFIHLRPYNRQIIIIFGEHLRLIWTCKQSPTWLTIHLLNFCVSWHHFHLVSIVHYLVDCKEIFSQLSRFLVRVMDSKRQLFWMKNAGTPMVGKRPRLKQIIAQLLLRLSNIIKPVSVSTLYAISLLLELHI